MTWHVGTQSWGEALSLTHCGRCGKRDDVLYWNGEEAVLEKLRDKTNWVCAECRPLYDQGQE